MKNAGYSDKEIREIKIVRLFKEAYEQGYQTPEMARKTNHTEQACDRYIKAYKKVVKLSKKMTSEEIAQTLEMGRALVDEYIKIMNEGNKK